MFKIPSNQDILDFIAQHVDVEMISESFNKMSVEAGGEGKPVIKIRTGGRKRYLTELSSINEVRRRVDMLVPLIAQQIADLSSDDIEIKNQCANDVFKQLRLLECVYNVIRECPIYTLVEQPAGNLAMVEFYLLPYLKRLSEELHEKYPSNFFFSYLNRYVNLIFMPLDKPMATFISEHKRAFSEFSNDSAYVDGYRRDRYKHTSHAIENYADDNTLTQFLGWHIAGNIIHSIIKRNTGEDTGEWCDDKAMLAMQLNEDYYDVIYKELLSLHANETVFNAVVANDSVEVQSIVQLFMAHIDGYEFVDDFISASTVKKTHRTLYKTLKKEQSFLYDFCQRVSNGEIQSTVDVKRAKSALDELYKLGHLGHDAFSFAHYIFIAKYHNGQAKKNDALTAYEQVMLESGVDPFTKIGLSITVGNVDEIDMTYVEHARCRYVGYFNYLLKNERSRYDFVNPIIEVERFLLSVIEPVRVQIDSEDRAYTLVEKSNIVKHAKKVKVPCVGVVKFGVKTVVANLKFFEHVFQLYYSWPEEDNDTPGNGIRRYNLLTEQQKKTLLEAIPDEATRIRDVDIDLIPIG